MNHQGIIGWCSNLRVTLSLGGRPFLVLLPMDFCTSANKVRVVHWWANTHYLSSSSKGITHVMCYSLQITSRISSVLSPEEIIVEYGIVDRAYGS